MNIKDRLERYRDKITDHFTLVGFGLGVLYWITKSIIYAHTVKGSITDHLLPLNQDDLLIRLIVVSFFILLGLLVEKMVVRHRREELRQSNEQFRQERARLEAVIRQMPFAVVISEAPSGRIILGNKQVEEIWRHHVLSSANVEEYGMWKGFHLEDGRPFRGEEWPLARSLLSGEVVTDEKVEIVRGDGTRSMINVRSAPIRDNEGKIEAAVVIFNDMAEARQVEETRSLLAAIVESMEDAVITKTLDHDGTITSWNRGAEEIYGYSAEEAVGRSMSFLFPPERLPDELSEILEKLRRGVSISHHETVRLRKDGERIDVDLTVLPLRGAGGRIYGAAAIERDITKRKRMEEKLEQYYFHLEDMIKARTEELRASQKQMAEAQKLAHAGSFEWDMAKDTLSFSDELLRIIGIEAQESAQSLEQFIIRFVHPHDQDYVRSLIEKACRDKEPFECQPRIIRPDGSVRILKGSAEVFTEVMGNPLRIIGSAQDITELKQAGDALRESEKKYRLIVENAQEGIWVIDIEARTSFVNSRLAEMLGYTVDEMLGKPVYSFMTEQHVASAQRLFERRKQAISERHEFELLHKDGSAVYTSIATAPIYDDSGHFAGAQALVTDITERKRAEKVVSERQRLYNVLENAAGHDMPADA